MIQCPLPGTSSRGRDTVTTVTKIEWTERTWNPTVGCTKVSPGCKHCYAETLARRLQAIGVRGYERGFALSMRPERLTEPLKRTRPTSYFVNSMSDLFHEELHFDYVRKVFDVMRATPQHSFQVLTKRAERMALFCHEYTPSPNVWLGVSVEDRKYGLPRIDAMRQVPSTVRFLSVEPLLEDLGGIDLTGIHWVIVGGESGPSARPMKEAWVDNVKQQCDRWGVAFFFKQWGTWGPDNVRRSKKDNGRTYRGRLWNDRPGGALSHY